MKLAQIVNFRVKKGEWDNLVALAKNWHITHSRQTDGHVDTLLWRKVRSPDEGTALVLFENEGALVSFSENQNTLRFFEEAKKYFDGSIDYHHAEVITADLISSSKFN